MKDAGDNVVQLSIASSNASAEQLAPPRHFRQAQKAAWADLLAGSDRTLHVPRHRFTYEMAATLLAKFRAGKAMTATEAKELKRLLGVLGVAEPGDGAIRTVKPNDGYFE